MFHVPLVAPGLIRAAGSTQSWGKDRAFPVHSCREQLSQGEV